MNIPFVNLSAQHAPIKSEVLAAVENVLDHGQFILGQEVEQFERRFADLCGTSYAVGVNSGTDALILALKALGVGPGDEVITVSNSFVASTGCITLVGATPVFIDVREDAIRLLASIALRTILGLLEAGKGRDAEMFVAAAIPYLQHLYVALGHNLVNALRIDTKFRSETLNRWAVSAVDYSSFMAGT